MFFPKGWFGVIIGLIWIGLSIWLQIYSAPIVKDADNMQKHGFRYSGETQLTLDQYNMIKQYNGLHDYKVEIIFPEPLTVKYGFLSLTDYDFLNKTKMPDKSFELAILPLFPLIGIAIGLLQLINSFVPDKSITKSEIKER